MIFICVKWKVKPEYADRWTELPAYVQETPLIRNVVMEGDHWDRLGEFEVR